MRWTVGIPCLALLGVGGVWALQAWDPGRGAIVEVAPTTTVSAPLGPRAASTETVTRPTEPVRAIDSRPNSRKETPTEARRRLMRARLAAEPNFMLASVLAHEIREELVERFITVESSGTGGWCVEWEPRRREPTAESFDTLRQVLERGLQDSWATDDALGRLRMQLVELALQVGDVDAMNRWWMADGEAPIEGRLRSLWPLPPAELQRPWGLCAESLRRGSSMVRVRVTREGQPMAGVHLVLYEPADLRSPETLAEFHGVDQVDMVVELFAQEETVVSGRLGLEPTTVQAASRDATRYAISDADGWLEVALLPEGAYAVRCVVPLVEASEGSWVAWQVHEDGTEAAVSADLGRSGMVTVPVNSTVQMPGLDFRPGDAVPADGRLTGPSDASPGRE